MAKNKGLLKCEVCEELKKLDEGFMCRKLNHYFKGGADMQCHSLRCKGFRRTREGLLSH